MKKPSLILTHLVYLVRFCILSWVFDALHSHRLHNILTRKTEIGYYWHILWDTALPPIFYVWTLSLPESKRSKNDYIEHVLTASHDKMADFDHRLCKSQCCRLQLPDLVCQRLCEWFGQHGHHLVLGGIGERDDVPQLATRDQVLVREMSRKLDWKFFEKFYRKKTR